MEKEQGRKGSRGLGIVDLMADAFDRLASVPDELSAVDHSAAQRIYNQFMAETLQDINNQGEENDKGRGKRKEE